MPANLGSYEIYSVSYFGAVRPVLITQCQSESG